MEQAAADDSSPLSTEKRTRSLWEQRLWLWWWRIWHRGRHGAQLEELLRALDRQDVDALLKKGVPLTQDPNERGEADPPGGAFGERTSFELRGRVALGAGGAMGLGEELFDDMRQNYERMAKLLESQGRVRDAAFVYSELLQEHLRAARLLEKHGHFLLAAKLLASMSEHRAAAIPLYLRGKRPDKAMRLALRYRLFGIAARELRECNKLELAQKLELLWANSLALQGNYLAAFRALRPGLLRGEACGPLALTFAWKAIAGSQEPFAGAEPAGGQPIEALAELLSVPLGEASYGVLWNELEVAVQGPGAPQNDWETLLRRLNDKVPQLTPTQRLLRQQFCDDLLRALPPTLDNEASRTFAQLSGSGASVWENNLLPDLVREELPPPLALTIGPLDRGLVSGASAFDGLQLPDGRLSLALGSEASSTVGLSCRRWN